MDTRAVKFLGGTTPKSFPHVCAHATNGASRQECRACTVQFTLNRDGCRGTAELPPCNSEERLCPICLALDPSGRSAKKSYDVTTGCCRIHVTVQARSPEPTFPTPEVQVGVEQSHESPEGQDSGSEQKDAPTPDVTDEAVAVPVLTGAQEDAGNEADRATATDVAGTPVPKDAVPISGPNINLEPLNVAQRVVLAKKGEGKMPYAIEIFSAVVTLSKEKKSNAEIGSIFGQTETSAAVWTCGVLCLRKLSEASWLVIHNAELCGRHVSLTWAAKVARSEPSTHQALLQKWATATKYARYND